MSETLYKEFEINWYPYSSHIDKEVSLRSSLATALDSMDSILWGKTVYMDMGFELMFNKVSAIDMADIVKWAEAFKLDSLIEIKHSKSLTIDPNINIEWAKTKTVDYFPLILWRTAFGVDKTSLVRWGKMAYVDKENWIRWAKSNAVDLANLIRWSKTKALDVSNFSGYKKGTGNKEEINLFKEKLLRWISVKGILILDHNIWLMRVSDSLNIPIMSGSVKIDIDSWLWQFNAVIPSRAAAKLVDPNVIGEPVEVQLTLDGYVWRFLIERVSEAYQYGEGAYSIYGRSVAAELDDPYSPKVTKTFDELLSSSDIISRELQDTGWTLTGNILEWNIPADVFSVTDMTKAKIIAEITKAIGGIFQAHPSNKELEFIYRFPTDPLSWEVDDPDEILHTGIILGQSIEAEPAPCYNYVIVSGKKDGVIVHVKRQNTLADIPAPIITDALITTENAGIQRGRNELNETGYNKIKSTIDLPLPHAESGDRPILLLPTHVVQVDDLFGNNFRGQVQSTEIKFSDSSVTMTVGVVRYLV